MSQSVLDRFWAKVNKTDTCWLWTGGTNAGYGNFHVDNQMQARAHDRSTYLLGCRCVECRLVNSEYDRARYAARGAR